MAFYLASTEILSISKGSQGVNMLVVSNRIQDDLKMCVEMCEPPVRDEVLKPEIKLTNGSRIKDIKRMSQEI